MKISQSQINLYSFCPYAYKLRYLDKCEPMNFKPELFEVGSRVHDTINIYYQDFYKTSITLPKLQVLLYNILRKDWDYTLPVELLKKAKQCLDNFAVFEITEMLRRNYEKPFSELAIYDKDLVGIIDYFHPDTRRVIDFKTSSSTTITRDYKVQASLYLYLVNSISVEKVEKFYFYFLPVNKLVEVPIDMSLVEEVKKFAQKIQLSLESGNFPKVETKCRSCPYRYYCKILKL